MATKTGRNNRRQTTRNNSPDGRNQYSGIMSSARDNPLATAAAVGGAVAAGIFLWSRRNQISDQIEYLVHQISEWREGMEANWDGPSEIPSGARTQAEIAEEALTLKEIGETA